MQYQQPYIGPIISQVPPTSYTPTSSYSLPSDSYISYSSSPSSPSSQSSQSSSFSTFPSTATFASMASTTSPSSFDAFGNPVTPAISTDKPDTPDMPDTQVTQVTPVTSVNTDNKEHIFINIIESNGDFTNSTVDKKKEIDIKGVLNKYTDYTFYIIITDKDNKQFYLYTEGSYSKNTDEYNSILDNYKNYGDYCIIIYEKNCLIVWYNTEINKTDIYQLIDDIKTQKEQHGQQKNSTIDFLVGITTSNKQNIMHDCLSNYVSTRFLENKFFKVGLIQNYSNNSIKKFINELDVCNGKSTSDRSQMPTDSEGNTDTDVLAANIAISNNNKKGFLSNIFGSKQQAREKSPEERRKTMEENFGELDDDLHDRYYGSRKKGPKYIMGQKDGKFGSNDIVYKNGYIDIEDLQRRINKKHPNFRINSSEKEYLNEYIPFWRDLDEDYNAKRAENPYSPLGEAPMKLSTMDSKVSKLLNGEHWIDMGLDANGNKIVDF
jgi:hypothetical protein